MKDFMFLKMSGEIDGEASWWNEYVRPSFVLFILSQVVKMLSYFSQLDQPKGDRTSVSCGITGGDIKIPIIDSVRAPPSLVREVAYMLIHNTEVSLLTNPFN